MVSQDDQDLRDPLDQAVKLVNAVIEESQVQLVKGVKLVRRANLVLPARLDPQDQPDPVAIQDLPVKRVNQEPQVITIIISF